MGVPSEKAKLAVDEIQSKVDYLREYTHHLSSDDLECLAEVVAEITEICEAEKRRRAETSSSRSNQWDDVDSYGPS